MALAVLGAHFGQSYTAQKQGVKVDLVLLNNIQKIIFNYLYTVKMC